MKPFQKRSLADRALVGVLVLVSGLALQMQRPFQVGRVASQLDRLSRRESSTADASSSANPDPRSRFMPPSLWITPTPKLT